MSQEDGVFNIPARRCKLCGGLLTSEKSIRDGYGHTCKMKARRKAIEEELAKDQLSLFPKEDPNNGEN